MSALALSVLLSLVSAVAYAGGAIVQERIADAAGGDGRPYAPLYRPAWWAAVALNGLGALLHVVALAYGPLSLVQPLGALTIVFALPMAALCVGRRTGATAWRGALMATTGLAGLLSLVGAADTRSLSDPQLLLLAVVTGAAVVALMTAARAAHRHPAVRGILLAVASGVAFGISSVFTKTVTVDFTRGAPLAELPGLAAIAVLATAGMLLSQASYRGAGLTAPLATLTVVNPVVAAAVGLTLFGETFRYGTAGTVLALGSAVVAAGGLILLTTERLGGPRTPAAAADPADGRKTLLPAAAAGLPATFARAPRTDAPGLPGFPGRTTGLPDVPGQPAARSGPPDGPADLLVFQEASAASPLFVPAPGGAAHDGLRPSPAGSASVPPGRDGGGPEDAADEPDVTRWAPLYGALYGAPCAPVLPVPVPPRPRVTS
ncbi:DMT family transporter [Streptomyces minutiscleroticus]|uniref:Membrane protein n=1 Tax=Streptomyces minutiscleroticus TaxID=68238 RepID=A0A918NQ71_9ACTN|nr:DMT family transporter [Streptomyces minutiscleroticus]GGX86996.1 membrane protein [Streptomyces minutiscleroticus]